MWFSISASAAGKGCFVATFDNITERKQIEQALRHAEEKYRALFQDAVSKYVSEHAPEAATPT